MDRQLSTANPADGRIVGPGDSHTQTVQTLKNIDAIFRAAGVATSHVVPTRIFVTNIGQWGKTEAALP